MIPTLVLTLAVCTLFFIGLGIRILVLKKGEFKGTCASQSPFLKNQIGDCQLCGKTAEEQDCRLDEDDERRLASA